VNSRVRKRERRQRIFLRCREVTIGKVLEKEGVRRSANSEKKRGSTTSSGTGVLGKSADDLHQL